MKKRILLAMAIVAMLVCLFAISVSADNIVASANDGYGELTTIDGVAEPQNISKDAKAVVVVNGTYYTIPSYYLVADNENFAWSVNGDVASKLGGLPTNKNVRNNLVRMEIPQGITTIGEFLFEQTSTLVEVTMPSSLTELGVGVFKACKNLVEVKNLENTQITALRVDEGTTYNRSRGVFINCTSLKSLSIPKTVTKIYPWSLVGCTALESFIIPEDSQLEFIGRYAFEDAKALTEIRLPNSLKTLEFGAFNRANALQRIVNFENTQVTEIGNDTFAGSPLVELNLPYGLTSIGKNAFKGNKIVQDKLVIPNGVTTIGGWAFAGTQNTTKIGTVVLSANLQKFGDNYVFENDTIAQMYIPAGLEQMRQGVFNRLTTKGVVFYVAGSEDVATSLKNGAGSSNDAFKNATVVDLETYNGATDKDQKNYIVYGINVCDAFYNGIHQLDPAQSNACAGVCANCGEKSLAANPVHNYVTTIVYENYLAKGVKTQTCQNEGCAHTTPVVTDVAPIISEFKGFSVSEKGDGITFGYSFDKDAIAEFEAVNGKIELGFVVAAKALLGENAPLGDKGVAASDKVVKASVLDEEAGYTGADFILRGNWDRDVTIGEEVVNIKNVEFYMAGYIIVNGAVSYLNVGASGANAGTVTFEQASTVA